MAITVAELQTLLTVDDTQFNQKFDRAQRRVSDYGTQTIGSPKLGLDTKTAEAALKQLRRDWEQMKRDMQRGVSPRIGAGSGTGAGSGSRGRSAADDLHAVGMRQMQTSAIMTASLTRPLLALSAASIKTGIEWESAFTGVKKTVTATTGELAALERQLRSMAAGQKPIPVDANELAKIAQSAGQLGIKVPMIAQFTRVIADLGVATNLTSEKAAIDLARFANILQMPQDEFQRLGSTIVDLGNKSATTERDIVAMAMRLAGAGKTVGLTAAQIISYAAALSSVGIKAESGGTAFSRLFLKMEQSARSGGKELELFAKVAGVSTAAFKKSFDTDASAAVLSFLNGLGRMKEAKANVVGTLKELGLNEIRVRDALLRAANAGETFNRSLRIGEAAWRDNIALTTEAEKRYATTASQLKILQNRMREQGIEISSRLLPVINRLLTSYGDDIPNAIRASAEAFDSLPVPIQKTSVALLALIALTGPTQMLVGNINLLKGAFVGLWAAAAANPVTAIAAVALLAGGYVILSNTFEHVRTAQTQATETQNELNKSMGRMLDVLPSGSKYASEIAKIRAEINAAGTDVGKLEQAGRDLEKVQAKMNIEVKNPDLRLVMNDEVAKAQSMLDRQKLTVTVVVQSVYKNITDTMGTTAPGRPSWELAGAGGQKSKINNLIDFMSGWGWNGEGYDNPNGAQVQQDFYEDVEALKYRLQGSEHTKRVRQQARQAAASSVQLPGMPKLTARNPLTGQPLNANTSTTFTVPTVAPYRPLGTDVEEARARLIAEKPKPKPVPVAAQKPKPAPFAGVTGEDDKETKAKDKADIAREKREREMQAALERWRSKQAQLAAASAKPWEKLDDTLSGLGARAYEFDKKTDGARLRAQMLRNAFDGIPQPIRDATVAMAELLDQTEELARQRDTIRDNNVNTLSQLVRGGSDPRALIAAIHKQEKAYNFGGRIDATLGKAKQIGNTIGPLAAAEAKARNDRADELREQNDPASYASSAPRGNGKAPAWLVGMEADSGKVLGRNCAEELKARLKGFGIGSMSGASTNRSLQVGFDAEGRLPSGTIVRYPPGQAGKGRVGNRYGHYAAVGSDTEHWTESNVRGHDKISSDRDIDWARLRADVEAGRAYAFAPKGALAGAGPSPKKVKTAVKPVAVQKVKSSVSAGFVAQGNKPEAPADGSLLPFSESQLNALLKAWGPLVTDSGVRPGESRENRLAAQDKLFNRLANGEKITPKQAAADRDVANRADFDQARTAATKAATAASREFNKTEDTKIKILAEARDALDSSGGSIAAYERAAFLAQKRVEVWNSAEVNALWNQKRKKEAIQLANSQIAKAAEGYDAQKADENHGADVALTKEQTRQTALLNAQREYLRQNAGLPEQFIADGLERVNRRQAEYNRLIDQNKTPAEAARLADLFMQGEKVNDGLRDRIELEKRLAAAQRDADDQFAGLKNDNKLAEDPTKNRGERDRAKAVADARRAKARELEAAKEAGTLSQDEFDTQVRDAGEDAFAAYNWEADTRKKGDGRDQNTAHDSRMAGMDARRRKIIGMDANNPELQIQLQLIERRNELEQENAQLTETEKFNVEERLNQYEEEIRAEDEIARITQSRQNLSSSIEQTLQLQKEHELQMAYTAADRLAIEQKYQNLLNERKGIEVSPEEKEEQGKQRDQTAQNESLENARSVAGQIRDLMVNSMDEGAKDGVAAMARHWAKGMADMIEKAAFNRIATAATNKIFGGAILSNDGDMFDVMKRGRQQSALPSTPGISALPSFVDSVRKKPFPLSPDIDINPFSPIQRSGAGGGTQSFRFDRADISIVGSATINAPNTSGAGAAGSGTSGPSREQYADRLFSLLA
jgi:TP901 family phage tail tape measure protein